MCVDAGCWFFGNWCNGGAAICWVCGAEDLGVEGAAFDELELVVCRSDVQLKPNFGEEVTLPRSV